MKKILKVTLYGFLGFVLVAAIVLSVFIYRVQYGLPFYESTPPTLPTEMQDFSVLVFSKTNGFPHSEAIEASIPAFEKMGEKNDWTFFFTDNGAVFNEEQLQQFDVVLWNNATGRNLKEEQRLAFKKYIENGGSFFGIHGTGDASHHWDWYYEQLIGANFSHHAIDKQIQAGNIHLACDSLSAFSCLSLPKLVNRSDEWYVFADNPRTRDFTVLYTLDETGLSMNGNIPYLVDNENFGMGADHPIVWYKCLPNGGRTFYSALGHTGASFSEPFYLDLLERGLKWAGKLEGDCR